MSEPIPEKKHRTFRGLLSKKDKDRPNTLPDSAYASSETQEDITAVENKGQFSGVDESRDLALDRKTGEVFDQDTGEIVTVVTTTTTTTTTTTKKGGVKKQEQEVLKEVPNARDGRPIAAGMTASNTDSGYTSEIPGKTIGGYDVTDSSAGITPSQTTEPSNHQTQSHLLDTAQPPLPPKSPHRRSLEVGSGLEPSSRPYDSEYPQPPTHPPHTASEAPPSPSRHNFSYPSRAAPEDSRAGRQSQGTLGNLKAAAVGIHGVGETLRGTFNSSIDQKFARKNPEKAALIDAKNRKTLDAGRQEMERLRPRRSHENPQTYGSDESHGSGYIPPTDSHPQQHHHGGYQDHNTGINPSTTDFDRSSELNYHAPMGTAVAGSESYNEPTSMSGGIPPIPEQEVETQERKKSGTLGKLFKRKPVAGEPVTDTDPRPTTQPNRSYY